MTERIPGGYYIKPRKISSSDINSKQPAIREIWDLLIREANFQNGYKNGRYLRRGQLHVSSYQDIRDALCWYAGNSRRTYSESTVKRAMKYFRETGRITTTNVPNGILITVCKYNYFQDPNNYERTDERTHEQPRKEPRTNPEQTGDQREAPMDDSSGELQKKEKKEKERSLDLYNFYLEEISPEEKTKQRSVSNIACHLKKHTFENLRQSILNYKPAALKREPGFRKNPANFFGKREKYFMDYLPENFETSKVSISQPGFTPNPNTIPESERIYTDDPV